MTITPCLHTEVTIYHLVNLNQEPSRENNEDIEGYFSQFDELLETSSDDLIVEPVMLAEFFE